jgi:hypothetical protein
MWGQWRMVEANVASNNNEKVERVEFLQSSKRQSSDAGVTDADVPA